MKLFIAIGNSQDHVPSDFFWSFLNIRSNGIAKVIHRGTAPWDVVRNNTLIKKFLNSNCDVFTRMDVDQTYPPNYFEVMLPLVEQYKVIGPVICDRWKQNNFIPLAFSNFDSNLKLFDLNGKSGIVEVPCPHTNLFFAREVFEKVPPPWFWHTLSDDGVNCEDHADRHIIRKIRDAGYKTYLNLDVDLTHISYQHIDRNFRDIWIRGNAI